MAKEDFCFTYYDGDAARDKAHMTRLERGAYDDLISAQRKKGHLTLDDIKKVLSKDFEICWQSLEWVLIKDEEDKYFIEWVDKSLEKMRSQSKKQKEKIDKYWSEKKPKVNNGNTTDILQNNNSINLEEPLVNENGNEDVIENEIKGKSENQFPKIEDVERVFIQQGGSKEMATAFFNRYEAVEWKIRGTPVTNFSSLVGTFITNWKQNKNGTGNNSTSNKSNHGSATGAINLIHQLKKEFDERRTGDS